MVRDMALIGQRNTLTIVRASVPGLYLDGGAHGDILLPGRYIPAGALPGHKIDVFVYRDSDDRPIVTMREPALELGQVTFLEVTSITAIGAFVNWGLPKELLVPYAEQSKELHVGERQPIGLYLDRSERLAGTMLVGDLLAHTPPRLRPDEWIRGEAWRNDPDIGLFVILDKSFVGLVPATEPHSLRRGDVAQFRVAYVQPDGKVVLSLRKHAHEELAADAAKLLAVLARPDAPRIGDRSDPELVRHLFGISKKAFKRAVGSLLKADKVAIDEQGFVVLRRR